MTTPFGAAYASQYDYLYRDKDYSNECELIEQAFQRYADGEIKAVLDLGCGTGNHALPLAQKGYQVTGVDLSSEMLKVARQKAEAASVSLEFLQGDIRNVTIAGTFDAGLIMFAVLGYLASNDDLVAALKNTRSAIRTGGLLLFDVWYGPAVLTNRPTSGARVITTPRGQVIRVGRSELDTRHHVCNVHYRLWEIEDNRVQNYSEELHATRFFFPMELEMILKFAGFSLLALSAFPTLDSPADETSWNAFVTARAI